MESQCAHPNKQQGKEQSGTLGLRVAFMGLTPKRHLLGGCCLGASASEDPCHGAAGKHRGHGTGMQRPPRAASLTYSVATASADAKLCNLWRSTWLHWFTFSKDVACACCLSNWSPDQCYLRDFGHPCAGSSYVLSRADCTSEKHLQPICLLSLKSEVVSTTSCISCKKIIPSCLVSEAGVAEHMLGTFLWQLRWEQTSMDLFHPSCDGLKATDTPWDH